MSLLLNSDESNNDQLPVADRKIIHIDMDAFFASVEQRENPDLKRKPVIVGGSPDSRGVVAAASYEARHYGVRSAMPCSKAVRLCPHAVFVRPNFQLYNEVSQQIRSIFAQFTDQIEPLSLDEAYLDVTDSLAFKGSATYIAQAIRQQVYEKTKLTASAGISYNKFLAKMASDLNKPNGMATLLGHEAIKFLEEIDVHKLHGVGNATAAKMNRLGIFNGNDLKQHSLQSLVKHFGKAGPYYYHIIRGVDKRRVQSHRERKSLGKERTFAEDIFDPNELKIILKGLCEKVCETLKEKNLKPQTVSLKYRYANFETFTRSIKMKKPTNEAQQIMAYILPLFEAHIDCDQGLRLTGLTTSEFIYLDESNFQLELFEKHKNGHNWLYVE